MRDQPPAQQIERALARLVVMADDVKLLTRRHVKAALSGCRAKTGHQQKRSARVLKPERHDRTWVRYMERPVGSQNLGPTFQNAGIQGARRSGRSGGSLQVDYHRTTLWWSDESDCAPRVAVYKPDKSPRSLAKRMTETYDPRTKNTSSPSWSKIRKPSAEIGGLPCVENRRPTGGVSQRRRR